jgi:hypothetical protein
VTPENLTPDSFEPHLGSRFGVATAPLGRLQMELVAVSRAAAGPRPGGSFSLVFRGPREPVLPQRIYRFEHAALGPLEIFIVPIGPDEQGMRYEAIFG